MSSQRIERLLEYLEQDGHDSFVLFALAMEYDKAGDCQRALQYFDRLIQRDPDYAWAYYHKGQLLGRLERLQQARACFEAGIPVAEKISEFHTRDKLREALGLREKKQPPTDIL